MKHCTLPYEKVARCDLRLKEESLYPREEIEFQSRFDDGVERSPPQPAVLESWHRQKELSRMAVETPPGSRICRDFKENREQFHKGRKEDK